MDFNDTPEMAAFRREAREWLAHNASRFTPSSLQPEDSEVLRLMKGWQAAKLDAGFAGFTLPKQYGGRGGSLLEEVVFAQEQAPYPIAHLPAPYISTGVGNAVPVMIAHTDKAIQDELLLPTLRADLIWAQLFSEPGAGSDVAAIRTRAVRDGDDWVINGQKVWSSGAHFADWAMLITRTDPDVPKHKGITYFFLDMKTPGVEVRPLKQLTGRAEFNEVFFTDVRIPDRYRVGKVNDGWRVIITTLMNERYGAMTGNASAFGGDILHALINQARNTPGALGGSMLSDDARVRAQIAGYATALNGLKNLAARLITTVAQGGEPESEGAITKMLMTGALQEMAAFAMDLSGPASGARDGLGDDLAAMQDSFFGAVGYRQGGGTDDVIRNIIAERTLGLPPDPRNDKDIPFSQQQFGA
ncbi:MAG: acyl-CoA dehydrogenase family protein [Porticoccaceae bacterium]